MMVSSKTKRLSDPFAALQRLLREEGSQADIWDHLIAGVAENDPTAPSVSFLTEQERYDDRAAAIIFAAILEQSLEIAIASHFVTDGNRIFSYADDGPLATFAAKVKLGAALGVYTDCMKDDLELLVAIRNAFAHARVHVDFANKAIILACEQLSTTARFRVKPDARLRCTLTAALISTYLRDDETKPRKFSGSELYRRLYGPPSSPQKS